jgi:hypothetical protein
MHYSESTEATFQSLNNIRLESFLAKICLEEAVEKDGRIKVGEEFEFMQKKYKFDFNSGDKSFYFIENNLKLIRFSTHWSKITGKKKVTECGYIRSCYWRLSEKNGRCKNGC